MLQISLKSGWVSGMSHFDVEFPNFPKKVNPMKYPVQAYILVRTRNLLFVYFTSVSHYTMKSILNVKKAI